MDFKPRLAYMALGGLLTLSGFLLASVIGDVGAQNQNTSVDDEIVCRRLKIVDSEGRIDKFKKKFGGAYAARLKK